MEKNRLQKVRKHVFYRHMNIVIKNWGKKTRENFFQKTHEYGIQKMLKKIVSKKCEKKFFKKHMNIVTKNGSKKSEKKYLPESYVYREQKTHGKKSSGKSAKTRFL